MAQLRLPTRSTPPLVAASPWQRTFAALRYPNYRLWFLGQLISLFGTWMQSTALGYLVFELTHSPAYLGYVTFAAGVPGWVLMLYGGVLADRFSRRNLMLVTQTSMLVLAFVLAALTFPHWVQPWHILVLAFLVGIANAFDAPARQAFVSELVDRADLTNAIALNGTMFNAAVALGPALGGLTYALLGPGWCFTLNGVSFLAVIAALALMRLGPGAPAPAQHSAGAELREGIRYVLRDPAVRWLVALVGVTGLFAASFGTLVPAWAVNILHGDATTNGLLQSGRGVGALAGALAIASLGRFNFKGRLLTAGTFVSPLLLLGFVWVRWLPLSLLVLAGVGAGFILIMNLANALVQTLVPDALRGRVMGVYSLVFFGTMPVGGLVMGALAQQLGEPAALVVGSSLALGFAGLAYLRAPQMRALE